ncbi:family 20 glycosylhydrolase [Aquipuribacter sp. SD81]|uniref:family 20 glycosylhydrolase n=1 Tax=Aquipuribacter sp. SD81 TaxID=3127703 RepID=UPI00301B272A
MSPARREPGPTAGLVPLPVDVEAGEGAPVLLGPGTVLVVPPSALGVAAAAAQRLARVLGGTPQVVGYGVDPPSAADPAGGDAATAPAVVTLALSPLDGVGEAVEPDLAREGYELRVGGGEVGVVAPDLPGLAHALTTLGQLAAAAPEATGSPGRLVAPVTVRDAPRYPWRGLSVDVARHPLPLGDLLRLVDLLADLRLNVLHLHLTDDQGWRLHVPSRPLLTERSGGTAVGGDPGGFLTEADWDALVGHAAARCVEVVPEVDVPGHVNAALHAYGELTPDGVAPEAYTGIEVGFSRLHADVPATEPFLRDVLGDVVRMTPGEHVHIGGDEVLTMDRDEYVRLVRMAADAVERHGRTVVAWQEAAAAPLAPGTLLQVWHEGHDLAPVVAAARAGARVVMSPASRAYLDLKYDASTPIGLEWAGHVPFRQSYEWDPDRLVDGLDPDSVAGVEAAVWSETTRDLDDVTYLLLPRLAAVAEVAWSPQAHRGWDGFAARTAVLACAWDRDGLRWHPAAGGAW